MTSIVAYRKATDSYTTYALVTPDTQLDAAGAELYCTELCTLDGVTYVAVPDGITLPEQPPQIASTVTSVTLTPELRDRIKAASPHCQFIDARMQDKIRALYSAEDEMYFARIGTGVALGRYAFEPGEEDALAEYGAHVEAVRQWGRTERAKLGL